MFIPDGGAVLRIIKNTNTFVVERVYDCPLSNIILNAIVVSVTDEDTIYTTLSN